MIQKFPLSIVLWMRQVTSTIYVSVPYLSSKASCSSKSTLSKSKRTNGVKVREMAMSRKEMCIIYLINILTWLVLFSFYQHFLESESFKCSLSSILMLLCIKKRNSSITFSRHANVSKKKFLLWVKQAFIAFFTISDCGVISFYV